MPKYWFGKIGQHAQTEEAVGRDVLVTTECAGGISAIGLAEQVQGTITAHAGGRLPDEVRAHDVFEHIKFLVVTDEGVNARLQPFHSVNKQHKVNARSPTNGIPRRVGSWHRPG